MVGSNAGYGNSKLATSWLQHTRGPGEEKAPKMVVRGKDFVVHHLWTKVLRTRVCAPGGGAQARCLAVWRDAGGGGGGGNTGRPRKAWATTHAQNRGSGHVTVTYGAGQGSQPTR